jgi:hypothetical protein
VCQVALERDDDASGHGEAPPLRTQPNKSRPLEKPEPSIGSCWGTGVSE